MTERLQEIFSLLPECEVFADVGCDHGYIAEAMLKSGKCKKAILADVSAKCLKKAQDLLSSEILAGKAVAIVSNGFDNLPESQLALIAGMGGQEIASILKKAKSLPEKLLLQPMKNSDEVRKTAVSVGYKIVKDYTFFSADVFYDLILLEKGRDFLTEEEIEFGRTNLLERGQAFIDFLKQKIQGLKTFSQGKNLKPQTRDAMLKEAERLQKYVDAR